MISRFLKRGRQSRTRHLFVRQLLPGNSSAMISHIPEELPLQVHIMATSMYQEKMLTQLCGPDAAPLSLHCNLQNRALSSLDVITLARTRGFPQTRGLQRREEEEGDAAALRMWTGPAAIAAQREHIVTVWAVSCRSDWWSADQWSHHPSQLTAGKEDSSSSTRSLLLANMI